MPQDSPIKVQDEEMEHQVIVIKLLDFQAAYRGFWGIVLLSTLM